MLAVLLIFRTAGLITGLQKKTTFYSWNDLQPVFSLHSTCASLLNKSSPRRMAVRREGFKMESKSHMQIQEEKKNSSLWISALILPDSMPNVYLKALKYHQFRIYPLPLLEVLFCHQICWTISPIQSPKDKKLAVYLFLLYLWKSQTFWDPLHCLILSH